MFIYGSGLLLGVYHITRWLFPAFPQWLAHSFLLIWMLSFALAFLAINWLEGVADQDNPYKDKR